MKFNINCYAIFLIGRKQIQAAILISVIMKNVKKVYIVQKNRIEEKIKQINKNPMRMIGWKRFIVKLGII